MKIVIFPAKLRSSLANYLPLFETAAAVVLAGLKSKVAGETGEMEEPVSGEVQMLLTSRERIHYSCGLLGLVKIGGITIAASRVNAKATYVTLFCKNCKNVRTVPCLPGLGGAIVPRLCDHIHQVYLNLEMIHARLIHGFWLDKSKYVDQQTLKLQENPEDVPTGELSRNLLLSVDRHLVQTVVLGTRFTIMGIYSIVQAANSSTSHKGAVAVRQPYTRVVGIEEANEVRRNINQLQRAEKCSSQLRGDARELELKSFYNFLSGTISSWCENGFDECINSPISTVSRSK